MNTALWNKIQEFDLDYPISEYGFSTRLDYIVADKLDNDYWDWKYYYF